MARRFQGQKLRGPNQPDSGLADVWPAKWVDGQRLERAICPAVWRSVAGNAFGGAFQSGNGAGHVIYGAVWLTPQKAHGCYCFSDGAAGKRRR